MLILKKGHQPGVYVPLRALFLVIVCDFKGEDFIMLLITCVQSLCIVLQ